MLKYILYFIPALLARGLALLLAPIAVAFSTKDKRSLQWPFMWMMTTDNDLGGDEGWKKEHITGDPLSYWNRVRWIWRNGGNAINYGLFGIPRTEYLSYKRTWMSDGADYLDALWNGDTKVSEDACSVKFVADALDGKAFFRRRHWVLKSIGRTFVLMYGWNLPGPKNGRCKYVFTIRLVKNKSNA